MAAMGTGTEGGHPESIGRYEIVTPIARGGMAEVFLGRASGEGGFQRLVTVKRILPNLAATEEFVTMFADEARILAELHHSNIGQVFEFGREGATYFIAMEYIRGVDLRRIYRHFGKKGALPAPAMAAFLVAEVCAALAYAHGRVDNKGDPLGIVHRDVSASNVLASFEGEVKLIDFGIARATQRMHETSGASLKGKFSYMSPEQARGQPLDHRSDIFGCGILLYELLTGQNPFKGETDLGTLERVRKAEIEPPSALAGAIPPDLEHACLCALSREPEDRYQDASELQEVLEQHCFEAGFGRRQLAAWMQEAFTKQMESIRRFDGQAAGLTPTGPRPDQAGAEEVASKEQGGGPEPDETKTTVFEGWLDGDSSGRSSRNMAALPDASGMGAQATPRNTDTTTGHAAGERSSRTAPPEAALSSRSRWLIIGTTAALVLCVALVFMLVGGPARDEVEPARIHAATAPAVEPLPPSAHEPPDAASALVPDLGVATPAEIAPGRRAANRARPTPRRRPTVRPRPARQAKPAPAPDKKKEAPQDPEDVEW